jgi:hypothetical protein
MLLMIATVKLCCQLKQQPSCAAQPLQPSACTLTQLRISVDERGYTRPATGESNVAVCLSLDENAAQRLIIDTLAPQPSEIP